MTVGQSLVRNPFGCLEPVDMREMQIEMRRLAVWLWLKTRAKLRESHCPVHVMQPRHTCAVQDFNPHNLVPKPTIHSNTRMKRRFRISYG